MIVMMMDNDKGERKEVTASYGKRKVNRSAALFFGVLAAMG